MNRVGVVVMFVYGAVHTYIHTCTLWYNSYIHTYRQYLHHTRSKIENIHVHTRPRIQSPFRWTYYSAVSSMTLLYLAVGVVVRTAFKTPSLLPEACCSTKTPQKEQRFAKPALFIPDLVATAVGTGIQLAYSTAVPARWCLFYAHVHVHT